MTEPTSIASIGDLSKPATVLVEKVCNAVGVLYEPTRIRRKAKAEADASKINALARLELSEIEERAFERLAHQEARKQENIEHITSEAIPKLTHDAKVDSLDEDWVANFFKQCDTTSDSEMRTLWAKILAGEASKAGSFSKRTVNIIGSLDKRDAALFTAVGQFVWSFDIPIPIILNMNGSSIQAAGVSLTDLKDLESLGLLSVEPLTGYKLDSIPQVVTAKYFDTTLLLVSKSSGSSFDLGKVMFTASGRELFPICGAKPNQAYLSEMIAGWTAMGMQVSKPAYVFGEHKYT